MPYPTANHCDQRLLVTSDGNGLALSSADCAFVLVAGGLGERLGYNDIKVSLPTEITSMRSYLQLYIEQILARQEASNKMCGTSIDVPLVLMTSDDTHDRTVRLLEENDYFGMKRDQLQIVKQEKVCTSVFAQKVFFVSGWLSRFALMRLTDVLVVVPRHSNRED